MVGSILMITFLDKLQVFLFNEHRTLYILDVDFAKGNGQETYKKVTDPYWF